MKIRAYGTLSEKRADLGINHFGKIKDTVQTSRGSVVLNSMLPGNPFTYPKSIYTVRDCVDAALNNSATGIVLDYFAGSGTTGHAVINLNREDNGNRKYILVEMGDYFDAVLKPRIKKVVYSKDWKDGKPVPIDN